jgi:methylated-DNA-[protein]-cysteine S-methyltransferase
MADERMMSLILSTWIGDIEITGTERGVSGILFPVTTQKKSDSTNTDRVSESVEVAARELTEYFEGKRKVFTVPLDPAGTTFQHTVWDELLKVPYGQTATYGEIAKRIGIPGASRAVGGANRRNPISIVIPCHRIIGSDGSLTGYGGPHGIEYKRRLLAFEKSRLKQ